MAQSLQLTYGPAGDGRLVAFLEILVSQVHEGLPLLDDMVEYDGY